MCLNLSPRGTYPVSLYPGLILPQAVTLLRPPGTSMAAQLNYVQRLLPAVEEWSVCILWTLPWKVFLSMLPLFLILCYQRDEQQWNMEVLRRIFQLVGHVWNRLMTAHIKTKAFEVTHSRLASLLFLVWVREHVSISIPFILDRLTKLLSC